MNKELPAENVLQLFLKLQKMLFYSFAQNDSSGNGRYINFGCCPSVVASLLFIYTDVLSRGLDRTFFLFAFGKFILVFIALAL